MNFKAVLFDLDGTLADSAPGILQSMKLALARFGITEEEAVLRRYLGPPLDEMFANYLSADRVADGVAAYREVYLAGELYHATLYPGIRELILALYEDGCKVCLATAKPQSTAQLFLEHFGLAPYFTVIGGVDEARGVHRKADVIADVVHQLGLQSEEVLMVGDRKDDLLGAAACSVPVVGAGYGYAPAGELEALAPFHIIRTPAELLPLVEGDFLEGKKPDSHQGRPQEPDKAGVTARAGSPKGLLAVAAVVVAVIVLVGCMALRGSKSSGTGEPGAGQTNTQTTGTVLAQTPDAGESYIEETLFAGDSNTVRLYNFGKISLQNMMAYVGIGVQSVTDKACVWFEEYEQPVTMVKAAELLQPRRIAMMFGTNNTSMGVDTFIEEYAQAYEALHTAYPYADIIIVSVPPVGASRHNATVSTQKIKAFNEALVALAEKKGCKFANVYEALSDGDGYLKAGYAESDGLHLTADGASALIAYLRCHSYETADTRPAVKNVPTRTQAPYMPSESEATAQLDAQQDAAQSQPQPTAAPDESTSVPQATPTPEPTATPEATPTPAPTEEPAPEPTPAPSAPASESVPAEQPVESVPVEDPKTTPAA